MSASGLVAWALAFYVVHLVRKGLETDAGRGLVDALAARIRGRPRDASGSE